MLIELKSMNTTLNIKKINASIREFSQSLGFEDVGFSRADRLHDLEKPLEKWLKNYCGKDMRYMEKNFELRLDPRKLFEGTRTVISLSFPYFQEDEVRLHGFKIAKYAYGKDYHEEIKKKLRKIEDFMRLHISSDISIRSFVDSAPIMEREWAKRSGLGWIGKNSLMLTKRKGSYFFLAEILVDVDLSEAVSLAKDYCGDCNRCIEACPTEAIVAPYVVDSQKCISYLTIELKEASQADKEISRDKWLFGCDICQEVCPINGKPIITEEAWQKPLPGFEAFNALNIEDLDQEKFDILFSKSPIKRPKFEGFLRNYHLLKP